MDVFKGVDLAIIAALSVFVLGIVQWIKTDKIPVWLVRLISLVISFALTALVRLLNPFTWQLYIVTSVCVFFGANGLWHTADQIGQSVKDNSKVV